MDTYNSNLEAIEIRKILNLKNHYLKIFTLNCILHYTSYGTTAETQISEALINLNNFKDSTHIVPAEAIVTIQII